MTCAFRTEDATFLSFSVFKGRINVHSLTHDRRGKKHANYVFVLFRFYKNCILKLIFITKSTDS